MYDLKRMKIITVLSGKGGVGKSSISASLSLLLSQKKKIITADCDVDASNLALVLGKKEDDFLEWEPISTNQKAVFNLEKCISCKKCFDSCYFKAIGWNNNKPKLRPFSCEGCEVCKIVCPVGAITMEDIYNAKIGHTNTKYGFKVVSAQLTPGESGSGKLVYNVKKKAKELSGDADYLIVDSAAGIGCPVIASVTGSDYCVLVAESTPSSMSDVSRALEIVNNFNIRAGLIINKSDINIDYKNKLEDFANKNKLDLLGDIPYNKSFSKALVEMVPAIEYDKKLSPYFKKIIDNLLLQIN